MSSQTILLVVLTFLSCTSAFAPICISQPPNSTDPESSLPQLPSQYYMAIEAVLFERNSTDFATEYYDGPGDRGRATFVFNGTQMDTIFDYNLGEAFIFPNPRTDEDCTVSLLNTNNTFARFLFGIVPGPNNTVHIGPPSSLFGLNNTINYTYRGIDFARGIPCHHWWTCTNRENVSFTLDYYFTDSDLWTAPYPQAEGYGYVPVLVELNGLVVDRRTGEERTTRHHYNFVDYRSGPDAVPDSAFTVPFDLVCKGRLPGQPLPQFPNVFSLNVETVYNGSASTYQVRLL